MLETEEVDDDYFTPVASTSLANIFSNTLQKQESDKSLKYKPPKPNNVVPISQEETKGSQCLFACALIGYEWFNNTYTPRGKLGFAIMKILKTDLNNIILYDANKTTLSCTIVSKQLEITVNENKFISYYDNNRKYWSIYATEEEIKKIEELLKNMNVVVKYSHDSGQGPPESCNEGNHIQLNMDQGDKGEKETDTDSSVNKKTKISILNRMANMGHSVLPSHTSLTEKTSDSSDTNDSSNHPKAIRHKPSKNFVKRSVPEKHISESCIVSDIQKQLPTNKTDLKPTDIPLFSYVNNQLVPVTHTNIISSPTNCDMNIYMSEQRICNSELRINMTRMTDKIDQIANKVNDLEIKNNNLGNNFQMEIMQKLLAEYENKIKFYDELLKAKGIVDKRAESSLKEKQESDEIKTMQMKITNLEQSNEKKDLEIIRFQDEIKVLKDNIDILNNENGKATDEYTAKITQLEKGLVLKSEQIPSDSKNSRSIIENHLKIIMNDTFRTICANLENNESYTGESVKTVIATVIKKVTVDCLSDL